MLDIHKKIVTDEKGNPSDVIIPRDEFQEIMELLGLNLDAESARELAKPAAPAKVKRKKRISISIKS